MVTIERTGPNRIDLTLDGPLDEATMRRLLDDFVEKSEGMEHGLMFYRIGNFEWPSLGAIGVELSRLPRLFGLIRRFDKAAVVANEGWIRGIAELEGALIPGLAIKGFRPGQEQEAETWLNA